MPLERHINAFEDQAEVLATMDVGSMWDRLLGEFLDAFVRFDREGLEGDDLDRELGAFMDGLSEKPVEDLARKSSSVAYNQGRAAEILSAAAGRGVEFVVRSEILDQATCEVCRNLDSMVVEVDSPEFTEFMPPSKCLGGDRCRGFYVAIAGVA